MSWATKEATARTQSPLQVLAVNLISCLVREKVIHCYGKIPMQRQFLTTSAESYISKSTQPVALRKITSQNNKELKSELREGIKNGAVTITDAALYSGGKCALVFVKSLDI